MPKIVVMTETKVKKLRPKDKKYRVACGKKLYLLITPTAMMYWHIRTEKEDGKITDFHIARYPETSFQQACEIRDEFFKKIKLEKKLPSRNKVVKKLPTFIDCAAQCIESKKLEWRNVKHASQWGTTLATYAYPIIGNMPISEIKRSHVLKILEPIWSTKTETATRVRGRIETVINWAKARDLFVGDNPACWEGGLKSILPNPSKVQKVVNHLSMPYQDIPALMKTLYRLNYPSANALKMTIFTACRTSEVLNIQLKEIKDGVWTIPAERMKAGVEHKVPLPTQLMAIIQDSKNLGDGSDSYLFTSLQKQSTLSNAAMTYLLKRLNLADVATVHGFRSSFRMWSAEQTNYPREVCEQALAHKLPDKVEAAYMRSDFLEKRKQLMQDWANYITSQLTQEDFDVYLKPAPNVFEQEQKSTIKDFETIHFSLKSRNRVK